MPSPRVGNYWNAIEIAWIIGIRSAILDATNRGRNRGDDIASSAYIMADPPHLYKTLSLIASMLAGWLATPDFDSC